MDYTKLTLGDIQRLVAAIEQAGDNPEVVRAIIDRVPLQKTSHDRVTINSVLQLLDQTGGSTTLPERIIEQLHQPELPLNQPIVAVPPSPVPLLQFIRQIPFPDTSWFVPADHFARNNAQGVYLFPSCADLMKHNFPKKLEDKVPPVTLMIYQLTEAVGDEVIISALDGRAEILFAHLWKLLKQQPHGEPGQLLTDGQPNICYIGDAEGTLKVVAVYYRVVNWKSAGWEMKVLSVNNTGIWPAGSQVLSRS